jgi:hypothetical protein
MIKKLLHKIIHTNQRGIALLFSLTFLALLMVLALAFASNAMIEQKVAYYGNSTVSSRMMANSALTRIIAMLKEGYDLKYSRNSEDPDGSYVYDYPYDLETQDSTGYIFQWDSSYNNLIFWDMIKQKQYDDGTLVDRIVGRVAYKIVEPSGDLLPVSLVENGVDEKTWPERRIGREINEINVRSVNTMLDNDALSEKFNIVGSNNGTQPAIGWTDFPTMFSALGVRNNNYIFNMKEWFIPGDDPEENESYWLDRKRDTEVENVAVGHTDYEMYQRFNLSGTSANVIDIDATAGNDYDESADNLNIWKYIANDATKMQKFVLLDWDGDGLRETSQVREFPPKWVDYDDYTATSGTVFTDLSTATYSLTTPDSTTSFRTPGLLWLANFGTTAANVNDETLKATFPTVTARRQQIAANLIDYSDADSIPTSDIQASTWGNVGVGNPTFTGNEKTPYINEIYFNGIFSVDYSKDPPPSQNRTINLEIDVDWGGEVVDMYKCTYSGTPYVKLISLSGSIVWSETYSSTTTHTVPFSVTQKVINVNSWTTNGYGNIPKDNAYSTTIAVYTGDKDSMPDTISIDSFKVDSATLMFNDGSGNIDYVKINSTNCLNNTASFTADSWNGIKASDAANGTIEAFQTFEVDDPRQNLNEGDWRMDYVDYSLPGGFTPGKNVNAVTDISGTQTNNDQEYLATNSDFPAYDYSGSQIRVSTAYIRNRPMISPWEIGFIHRGAKWQTINLKKYNTAFAVSAISSATGNAADDSNSAFNIGGGAYVDGDANIFDQIKMTSAAKSATKVNIKVEKTAILKALLNKLSIGSDPVNFENKTDAVGGTLLTATQISDIYDEIINNTTANIENSITRAHLANVPLMTTTVTSNITDAKQEELIGKVINLTKSSDNAQYFTVIIVAQTIRDIGGNGTTVSITKANANGTSSVSKDCQLGVFDYTRIDSDVNGDGSVDYFDESDDFIYDEILSTTKIMVRLYVSDSGEVKVVSYQYVN